MKVSFRVISIFKEFIKRHPKLFIKLFFLLVAEGIAAAMSVLAVVPLADFLMDPSLKHPSHLTVYVTNIFTSMGFSTNFWLFGLFFVVLQAIKATVEVVIKYATLSIKYTILRGLISDAIFTFFKARWTFFSSHDQGFLMNTMTQVAGNVGDTLGQMATFLAQIVQLAIYLAVPFWLNPTLTFTMLGFAALFSIPFVLTNRISFRMGKKQAEVGNMFKGVIMEVFGGARLIMGFGRQSQAKQQYLGAYDKHMHVELRSQTLSNAVPKFFQPLGTLAAVIAMGLAFNQKALVSELVAVMWSLMAAVPIITNLIQANISIMNFLPSYDQLMATKKKAAEHEEIEGTGVFEKLEDSIELRDLSFTYPGRSQTITGINISIKKGRMTALVGESGSGKSTITDLVLGLQVPDKGEVLIDGISLNDYKQNTFREKIGYVPQDPLLFHESIRNNLLWSYPKATETDLWEALRLANAESFVKELPKGIDTQVGDRGVRLSGGQRQRIALARSLLRKPELLILDEATSSLDSESERLIQQSIEQLAQGTTILVIAHRLSTIAKADSVYILRKGKVVEEGSFASLSSTPYSILNTMITSQQAVE